MILLNKLVDSLGIKLLKLLTGESMKKNIKLYKLEKYAQYK